MSNGLVYADRSHLLRFELKYSFDNFYFYCLSSEFYFTIFLSALKRQYHLKMTTTQQAQAEQKPQKLLKPKRILDLTGCNLTELPEKVASKNTFKVFLLSHNRLTTLPDTNAKLRILKLAYNKFGGSIPPGIWNCIINSKKLQELDLSSNFLKEIPNEINDMSKLNALSLFDNKLTSINVTSSSIRALDLGHNLFTTPPQFPSTVEMFGYSYNSLESLDESFPNYASLQFLAVGQCGIKSISPTLCMGNLKTIVLSINNLTEVPDLGQIFPSAEKIDLSDNYLTAFPTFPHTIEDINLNHNQISNMPGDLNQYANLKKIQIAYNNLTEFAPLGLSVTYIDASNNQISSVSEFSAPALEFINFTSNNLTSIPQFNSQALKIYILAKNNISEINTEALSPVADLLNLHSNEIVMIPTTLFATPITTLNLFNNHITQIPYEIESWTSLSVFNISRNPLEMIPTLPIGITQLFAGYCGLWELQENLGDSENLSVLCIPGNNISWLPKFKSLRYLYASRNKFLYFPELPETIEFIDLSYNGLSAFPEVFVYPRLFDLDVSHNDLMNSRHFRATKLSSLRLNNNPITTTITANGLPYQLSFLDVSNTNITLLDQPQVNETLANSNPNKWFNVKTVSTGCYSGYAQTRGIKDTLEDSILSFTNVRGRADLFGVFDGHNGPLAAVFSSKQIAMLYESQDIELSIAGLERVLRRLVQSIRENKIADGACCSFALVAGQQALITTIGSTKTMLIKKGGQIKLVTDQHKPSDREEIDLIKQRGGFVQNKLTMGRIPASRALGDSSISGVTQTADIQFVEFENNDRWLVIGSDGLYNVLSDETIADLAARASCAQELAYDLRNIAFTSFSTENISVVVVDLERRLHALYQRAVQ
ncbi:hypothetical protein TRFO_23491 [Tritrichomonas foetus]|uniref:PPM-type phosphatase domain-containing protein n=1 Tax=Tritrichomonas foetus TaxID=1144522 RepID=A0A1J4KEH0_9EUKA|nr:hypothetical protein TRFO_23491 [Tritrichomonas foetus]|eukprot:OHT08124.1 hypothetical protein TRFO_23491 [Tritrichomonas foetus]